MSNELKVAITVIISLIVAYFGFRIMQDLPVFRQSLLIQTKFDRVDGLNTGNYIFINGVKVGSVQKISLTKSDSVLVTLGFDLGVNIPEDSKAYLESSGLLDEKAIIIEQGDSDEMLGYGDSIEGIYQGGMMETLEKEGEKLSNDISNSFNRLNTLLDDLNEVLKEENKARLSNIFGNLETATGELSEVMENKRGELESSLDHLNSVMANLDTVSTNNKERIDSVMVELEHSLQEVGKLSNNLATTSDRLNSILGKINEGEGSLGKLVNDESLYTNVDSLAFELKTLIKNINEDPNRYLKNMRLIEVF